MTFLKVIKCIILLVADLLQVFPCHLRFGDNASNKYNFIIGVGSTNNTSF